MECALSALGGQRLNVNGQRVAQNRDGLRSNPAVEEIEGLAAAGADVEIERALRRAKREFPGLHRCHDGAADNDVVDDIANLLAPLLVLKRREREAVAAQAGHLDFTAAGEVELDLQLKRFPNAGIGFSRPQLDESEPPVSLGVGQLGEPRSLVRSWTSLLMALSKAPTLASNSAMALTLASALALRSFIIWLARSPVL